MSEATLTDVTRGLLHSPFELRAVEAPGALALAAGGRSLTYGELDARAERLAGHLVRLGVGPESLVGICASRSPEMVIGILGVLKAGAAYVPLDPEYPESRLAFMLEDSGATVVLTEESLVGSLPGAAGRRTVLLDAEPPADEGRSGSREEPKARKAATARPGNLAYLIYTSGSTGWPKGVAIEHRSAVAMVRWALGVFGPTDLAGVLFSTSICFDLSIYELFVPLAAGGTVVLAADALELPTLPADPPVTLINTVPSAMSELVSTGGVPETVRTVNLAGEPLRRPLVDRVYRQTRAERVFNLYGPSEDTTYSTFAEIARQDSEAPSIGRPVTGTRAVLLDPLDPESHPVRPGEVGELLLGGTGLARGYFRRPALTAERFVPDPFPPGEGAAPGGRLYRTGDLARALPDGRLHFLGRADHQVKIRGFRIELGEVETALLGHSAVGEAVVTAREGAGGQMLVAYVTAAGGGTPPPGPEALRTALGHSLPDYMVPSLFVVLDALPRTPNGKVDRRALPVPEAGAGEELEPPATPTEEALARIWAEVLEIGTVGRSSHFFTLGGHSLLATRVVSRVREAFGVELSMQALFDAPTLRELAARVDALADEEGEARAVLPPLIRRGDREAPVSLSAPLSFAQQRLWILDRLQRESVAYNLPSAFRLEGALDRRALAGALAEIVRRHEALRTRFEELDGEPVQRIDPPCPLVLPVIDLGGLPAERRRAETVRLVRAEAHRPFDLARGPLVRAALVATDASGTDHLLLLCLHHIVSDGWSQGVMNLELAALYRSHRDDRPSPLEPLQVQYADFAVWQHGWPESVFEDQLAYWRGRLESHAVLEIVGDRPRPPIQSFRGAVERFEIDPVLVEEVKRLAREGAATPFMVLLALFQVLMFRSSGQDDLVIGVPVANRGQGEIQGLVGFFVNLLALRTDLSGGPGFRELLRRVRATSIEAFDHQDLPFERLVEELRPERDLSRNPICQVAFQLLDRAVPRPDLAGLRVSVPDVPFETTRFDLGLTITEADGRLTGALEYASDLFDRTTARRTVGHLLCLLRGVADDPDRPLGELPLLTAAERHALLVEPAGPLMPGGGDPLRGAVHAEVVRRAGRAPDVVAVAMDGQVLSLGELDRRSARLAAELRALGAGPETVVGVCLERSVDLVVALLATLRAGSAYLPLDPADPDERLTFMVKDASVPLVVCRSGRSRAFGSGPGRLLVSPGGAGAERASSRPAGEGIDPAVGSDHLAYVIYTSGSTGRPKGVGVGHGGLANLVAWHRRAFGLTEADRSTQLAQVGFDASVWEVWSALGSGATLHLPPDEVRSVPEALRDWLVARGITVSFVPTPLAEALLALPWPRGVALRALLTGGDRLHGPPPEGLPFTLINDYGPTEAAVVATSAPVPAATAPGAAAERVAAQRGPSIGRPIDGVRVDVLDARLLPVPLGIPGELSITGAGLARGYLGRPGLTAERFVPSPVPSAQAPGARLYRTGDLVRRLPDGTFDFLGRVDRQVKVRGFRIEPEEVESVLAAHPEVREAAVVVHEDGVGSGRLVAYLVPTGGGGSGAGAWTPAADALRAFLRRELPDSMVPWVFVPLERLPTTSSGKVDRRALERLELPAADTPDGDDTAAPQTETEELLAGIWSRVLGVDRMAPSADFFELGGHSLLAAQVVSRIRDVFEVEVPLGALFTESTLAGTARRVEELQRERAGSSLPPLVPAEPTAGGAGGDRRRPLSYAQQRLWFLARLDPDDPTYNIPIVLRLRGALDRRALARALAGVVRRHETLRTRFLEGPDGPYQEVLDPPGSECSHLVLVDLGGLPRAARDREAEHLSRREAWRPFDLARPAGGSLLRSLLVATDPARREHLLLLTMHHIASDGWSQAVLHRDLSALYRVHRNEGSTGSDAPDLPALPVQYADFATWQRSWLEGEALERQLEFWRNQLAGVEPVLELPTDRPRPPVRTFRGANSPVAVAPERLSALRGLARRQGVTLFMTLLTGFQAVLGRYTGRSDVLVGTAVANRNHSAIEELIGFFVNALVMRGELGGDPRFAELLERTRKRALAAYGHQDLPFERLVDELSPERNLSHQPLIQVMFGLQSSAPAPIELDGVAAEEVDLAGAVARFDLTLLLFDDGTSLRGVFEYNTDLFDAATVHRLAGHLETLLGAGAESPTERLSRLPLLSPAERQQLLGEWNDTRAPYRRTVTIEQLFAERASRQPDAIAVLWKGRALSYRELAERAHRLSALLHERGVRRGSAVGIWMERSLDMVVSVLAVLEAGGFYLPLDAAWPSDRVEGVLFGHRAPVLLTRSERLSDVLGLQWRLPALTDVVCLDVEGPEPPPEPLDVESVRALWDFIAERAVDRESAGGFVSSFTGEAFSPAEVDEYRDRVLALAEPFVAPDARVLEIGCGSGLILWELAPRVGRYVGVDPSVRTQERNRERVAELGAEGLDLELVTGFAHELDAAVPADGEPFDLVLLASTVQFFPGPRYLERVLGEALRRLAPGGAVVVADVMDARRRGELETAIAEHAAGQSGPSAGRSTQGDELFLDEGSFLDFAVRHPEVGGVEIAHREEGFTNELGYRYDVVLRKAPAGAQVPAVPAEPVKRLWTGWHLARLATAGAAPPVAGPDDLAYVIYTSGSTGTPKGIVVQHRPVVNLIEWVNRTCGIGPGDRLLFVTSLCFDLSVYDLFGVLAAGGTIHVAPEEALRDPEELLRLLREGGVTVWDSAPAALQQLAPLMAPAPGGEAPPPLRRVLLSGDWIPVALPDRVRAAFSGARVVSLGGATEATVWSNWYPVERVDPEWASIPYGRPTSNARYHVLSGAMEPCPAGVPGDLYIGGECLCTGYAHQPALTAAQFVPDPFADRAGAPGARLYRTGDRARHFPDGTLEFLGRTDHQVKIRGFRIELGEIEVTLERHPAVRQAVVLARPAPGGDRRLVAYVEPAGGDEPEPGALRDHLRQSLPEYMVPAAFARVAAMPVTANGKVDRKALAETDPAPETAAGGESGAPTTPVQELIAEHWTRILGLERVGVRDNFFELGGHSLLATQVVARLRESFGVEVPLRTLFQKPTVAELAAAVEASRGAPAALSAPPIVPLPRDARAEPLPLSFSQLRLWFLTRIDPRSADYNLPLSLRFAGPLEPVRLARALVAVTERHEVLRTTFRAPGGRPEPVIHPRVDLPLPVIDLSALPEPARAVESRRLVAEDVHRPIDLAVAPLLRTALLRLAPGARESDAEHLLLLTVHHIVFDGWSLGILTTELAELYDALGTGRPAVLPSLEVQYADFAHWQRTWLDGEILDEQLRYWRSRLEGAPPLLALPTDRARPAVQSYRAGSETFTLPSALADRLRRLASGEGSTLFMVLLAAFELLLYRYTGQSDFNVGTFVANRRWQEIEKLVGFFVNTLVLRGDLSGAPTFRELLGRVRGTTLEAFEHQELPFERLLEEVDTHRDLSRTPLFQVMFGLQNFAVPTARAGGLEIESVDLFEEGRANADLALWMWEEDGGLWGWLQYNSDLFDATTAQRVSGHLRGVLEGLASDPDLRASDVPMLSAAEHHQVLVEQGGWRAHPRGPAEAATAPVMVTAVGEFLRQAAEAPDAAALVCGEATLSYGALERRSRQAAWRLAAGGAAPETVVGLCLERGIDQMVALLGILRVGAAYLPLDPEVPAERLAFVLEDAGAVALIARPELAERLEGFDGARLVPGELVVGGVSDEPAAAPAGALAYVIYTSGSTGTPKGVQIDRRSLATFTATTVAAYGLGPRDRVLQFGNLSFDASVEEIFPPLAAGATVVLRGEEMLASPRRFLDDCARHQVSVVDLPTAYWHELAAQVEARADPPRSLRLVIIGGEAALPERVAGWLDAVGTEPALINTYGPTEATVVATSCRLGRDGSDRAVPIGRPLDGVVAYVLDRDLGPLPVGVPGELLLGGAGLARGYLGHPRATAERFVPDPFAGRSDGEGGGRLYRTGDLVRRRPDGEMEFVGRIDHQVKIRGFRIEPDEIAAVLCRHPGVREAVVVVRRDGLGGDRLAAYMAASPEVSAVALRERLRDELPAYMVPADLVFLDSLPLTSTGKVDRKALPEPERGADEGYVPPETPSEELIAEIWCSLLGVDRVGVHDDFFDLGGHSLLAPQVVARIGEELGIEPPLRLLLEAPTVARLALAVEELLLEQIEGMSEEEAERLVGEAQSA